MLDLVATGPEMGQRWRRQLAQDVIVRLGRTPQQGWDVPWDMRVSREHADLQVVDGKLRIHCVKNAMNAVYFRGEPFREVVISAGEDFRIGETTFRLERVPDDIAAEVVVQQKLSTHDDQNETNVISELCDSAVADLEASVAHSEAAAQQAGQLAEQRLVEIQRLHKKIDSLLAEKPADDHERNQAVELCKAKALADEQAAELKRLREENDRLNRELLAATKERDLLAQENAAFRSQLTDERIAAESRVGV